MRGNRTMLQGPLASVILIVAFAVTAVLGGLQGAQAQSGKKVNALWVWEPGLLNNGWEDLLNFAVRKGVNRIYFGVDTTIKPSRYQPFIRQARTNGISVEALSGRASWVYPENRSKMIEFARWVGNYNQSVASEERFAAIRLDLEPHQLPEWKTDRDRMITLWTDAVKEFVTEVHGFTDLKAHADLPFWLDGQTVTGTSQKLHDYMIGMYDAVTIMAYRNYAEGRGGILDVAASEVESARLSGKEVTIGVETRRNEEAPTVSFYGMTETYMQEQLQKVMNALDQQPAFAGISVHDYTGWKQMKP